MKKCISFLLAILFVITALPMTVSAGNSADYRNYYQYISTPGMPQYIRGIIEFDPDKFVFLKDYKYSNSDGIIFDMATDEFDYMYDVDFTVEDDRLIFEYTLKPGFDYEYFLDCLDRIEKKHFRFPVDRSEGRYHEYTLFHAAVCFRSGYSESDPAYSFSLLDMVNSDGTVFVKDGQSINRVSYSEDLFNFYEYEPVRLNTKKHKELFLSQYKLTEAQLVDYKLFYEHKDADGAVDWALVSAKTNITSKTPEYYEFGNRVLSTANIGTPFAFHVGIYNAKRGRFVDLTECTAEDYEDMEEVWMELGSGRLLGDMDGDDSLTVTDAALIQRCQAAIMDYPAEDINPYSGSYQNSVAYFSDFDQDSERGIIDATMIQRFLAELPHRTAEYEPYVTPTEAFRPSSDPSIPSITGFRSVGKGIEISIGTVPGAEKYRVYFKNKNGNWEKMGETTGAPFVSTNAVEVGKTYTYTVRCIKADLSKFTSDYDKTGWSYTYEPQLDTPRITHIEVVGDSYQVNWAPVEGADLYRVFYKKGGVWTQLEDTRDTSCMQAIEANPSKTVKYTVQCLSQGGRSTASEYDPDGMSFTMVSKPSLESMEVHVDGVYFRVSSGTDQNGRYDDGNVAVFRYDGSTWEYVVDLPDLTFYTDTDVEPGKTYLYTCMCLSPDGTYFVSQYDTTGWIVEYTLDECIPEMDYFMYLGEGRVMIQPNEDNKFHISKYQIDLYNGDTYYDTYIIPADEFSVIQDSIFNRFNFIVRIYGLNEKEEKITSYRKPGESVYTLNPADNLRVQKLGERKYRFRWDKSPSYTVASGYTFTLISSDGQYVLGGETPYLYYDVVLDEFSEEIEWYALTYTTKSKAPYVVQSYSDSTMIEFRESDFNSETE